MKAASSVFSPRLAVTAAGVSQTSTRPACINEMRSQRSASFMKWVEMKIVTLSCRERSTIIRQNMSRAIGSTPEVGSSSIRTSGLWTTATASDRRWRTPTGRLSGIASITPARPKRSTISVTRPGTSAAGTPKSCANSFRFCATVSSE